jgi:hypothetical protein
VRASRVTCASWADALHRVAASATSNGRRCGVRAAGWRGTAARTIRSSTGSSTRSSARWVMGPPTSTHPLHARYAGTTTKP